MNWHFWVGFMLLLWGLWLLLSACAELRRPPGPPPQHKPDPYGGDEKTREDGKGGTYRID